MGVWKSVVMYFGVPSVSIIRAWQWQHEQAQISRYQVAGHCLSPSVRPLVLVTASAAEQSLTEGIHAVFYPAIDNDTLLFSVGAASLKTINPEDPLD